MCGRAYIRGHRCELSKLQALRGDLKKVLEKTKDQV